MNTTAISTWPISTPSRWNVLLEALLVGNTVVTPTTDVVGAPSNRAVVLLDSGTSYTYVRLQLGLTLADLGLATPQPPFATQSTVGLLALSIPPV
jgi:hypothetical protein